ncbi:MAG: formylglycine-generating enzyme family protein [Bdellovibrionales bacterium]|nr:formylglycine-generating enzyme family protein [Bdellovibrionales bacterium]
MKFVLTLVISFSVLASSVSFGGNVSDAMDPAKVGLAATFVSIKAGTFMMGSPEDERNRYPDETQHQVTLTKDFEMQATPVTQLQYFLVTGDNPSFFRRKDDCPGSFEQRGNVTLCPNHPVENISWFDAQDFIGKLNKGSGAYYRLPTEAEYEYALRGGTTTAYFFGDGPAAPDDYAWTYPYTHEVGQFKPNPYALYDIIGNIWEWTQDWYGNYPAGEAVDPPGPAKGSSRVLRGGSWNYYPVPLRSALRFCYSPGNRNYGIGFRLVRTPK